MQSQRTHVVLALPWRKHHLRCHPSSCGQLLCVDPSAAPHCSWWCCWTRLPPWRATTRRCALLWLTWWWSNSSPVGGGG